jgi:hypothetical protein
VADSATIGNVIGIMKSYLSENINVYDYAYRLDEVLDKPFEDKTAQRILQGARWTRKSTTRIARLTTASHTSPSQN